MKIGPFGGAAMALASAGLSHAAYATTWEVNCPGSGDTTLSELSPLPAGPIDFPADPGGLTGTGHPANTVTGGIECPFTTFPNSHLVFATDTISPVPTELAADEPPFTTAQKSECRPF